MPFEIPEPLYESLLKEQVVLFSGAGISTESNEVFPYTLYQEICSELSIPPSSPPFPVAMSKFVAQSNGRAKLLRKIKERLEYVHSFSELEQQATAFHKELSTIFKINSIITTNWDNYFEQECGATRFVSAEDFVFWDLPGRKVLKIHGSADSFGSIVATDEDYRKCYQRLSHGLLGSRLKVDLATKTLVYIGFSFSDYDFLKVHRVLTAEMKGLRPQSYIVSLDRSAEARFRKEGLTPIFTDGTFFLSEIKKRLVKEGHMLSDQRFDGVERFLAQVQREHTRLANTVDVLEYPDVIYALSYQDGLLHALKRILTLKNTGYYSNPHNCHRVAWSYHHTIRPNKLKAGRYADVAYVDGYADGHLFLIMPDDARRGAPIYYVFGHNESIHRLPEFKKILPRSSRLHSRAHRYAKTLLTKSNFGKGLVFHHRPALF